MTLASCFVCGALKVGAWTPCPVCGANPATDEEMATSLALTDHYLTPENLAQVGQRIAAEQPVAIPEEFYAQLLARRSGKAAGPLGAAGHRGPAAVLLHPAGPGAVLG